jgi:hypothetical protein
VSVFPPTCWQDIAAYDTDEVVQGYRDWRPDDPEPGPNHSPGYRWGWANMKADHTHPTVMDELYWIRRDYAREAMGIGQTRH